MIYVDAINLVQIILKYILLRIPTGTEMNIRINTTVEQCILVFISLSEKQRQ